MSPDGRPSPPEEKLLKLIREKSPKPAAAAATSAVSSVASVVIINDRGRARFPRVPWSSWAIAALMTLMVLEVVWLVFLGTQPPTPVTVPPIRVPAVGSETPAPSVEPTLPSLATTVSRPLFAAPVVALSAPQPSAKTPTRVSQSGKAKELAGRLTLMGIVSGNPPQAIIEDSQTKKTYFVTTGQVVVDGAVLDQVLDNRVTLNLDGETIELTL